MQEQFAGQPITLLNYGIDYSYRIADDTIYLVIRCPITADCVGSFTGEASGRDSLLLESGGEKYLFVRANTTWPPYTLAGRRGHTTSPNYATRSGLMRRTSSLSF